VGGDKRGTLHEMRFKWLGNELATEILGPRCDIEGTDPPLCRGLVGGLPATLETRIPINHCPLPRANCDQSALAALTLLPLARMTGE
jgi:hypothetical protein